VEMNGKAPTPPAPILFVEDDELYATLIGYSWSKVETNVPLQWFENGKKAVAYLQKAGLPGGSGCNPVPQLILTDLNMPVLDGFGLLKWVRQNQPFAHLPVIVLSGCASKENLEEAYLLGADLCLEKPRGLEETIEMLRVLAKFWSGASTGKLAEILNSLPSSTLKTQIQIKKREEASPRQGLQSWQNGNKQSFSFHDPSAKNVQLVGTFTQWEEKPVNLNKERDGVWRATVQLEPGTHRYRFLVDGQWRNDPNCDFFMPNPFGGEDAVRRVD